MKKRAKRMLTKIEIYKRPKFYSLIRTAFFKKLVESIGYFIKKIFNNLVYVLF